VVLPAWELKGGWMEPPPQWQLKHFLDPKPTDLGFVNLTEDDDHFLRRQQLHVGGDKAPLHFALALFALEQAAEASWKDGRLYVGAEEVPLDAQGKLRVNFVGPTGSFPTVPFRDALKAAKAGNPLPVDVDGAVVIVGVTARSQQDYHPTPYANNYWRYL